MPFTTSNSHNNSIVQQVLFSYDTEIPIGEDTYTVKDILRNIRVASTALEASRWANFVHMAMLETGVDNSSIRNEIKHLLVSKGEMPITVGSIKAGTGQGCEPPQNFKNTLFVSKQDQYVIDHSRLWLWLYNTLVRRIQNKYEWLAGLLFACHHNLLLTDDTKSYVNEMSKWYPGQPYTTHPCTQEPVNTYRRGFFRSPEFDYTKWVNCQMAGKDVVPKGYEYDEDQTHKGFHRLWHLCANVLEEEYRLDEIIVKNTNN